LNNLPGSLLGHGGQFTRFDRFDGFPARVIVRLELFLEFFRISGDAWSIGGADPVVSERFCSDENDKYQPGSRGRMKARGTERSGLAAFEWWGGDALHARPCGN
jgi:hypothetical protein